MTAPTPPAARTPSQQLPSFDVSREASDMIRKIAGRAVGKFGGTMLEWSMDLTATHANGCALKLDELLAADEFNFAHDLCGIRRHIDRTTGALGGCFCPRYARQP